MGAGKFSAEGDPCGAIQEAQGMLQTLSQV